MSTSKLLTQGIIKMLSGMLMIGLVLFLPAGTWAYPNGCSAACCLCPCW